MTIDINSTAPPATTQEADAALTAIAAKSKAENARKIAELSQGTDDAHVAAHVRGMVAGTMGHLSADASAITRINAEHWQDWALGVADGVAQTVPAAV